MSDQDDDLPKIRITNACGFDLCGATFTFDPVVDLETYLLLCPPSEVSIDAIDHGERLS